MAEIARKKQKIFAKNAIATDLGVVGSKSNGTVEYSTDVETLQSLPQFETGLRSMVTATDAPYIQDQNSLFYIITSQLAYLFQNGIAEWEEGTEYFALKSYVSYDGRLYLALQDSTNKTPSTETEYWKDILTIENITNLQSELSNKANTALTNLIQGLSNTICTTPATTTSSATNERPAVIVKNWVSGRSWYRIWSDGWCEQGGYANRMGVINLHIAMKNTNYTITEGHTSGYHESNRITAITTTSFTLANSGGSDSNCLWKAEGYCTGQTATTLFNQTAIGNGANIVNELYTKTFTGNAVLSINLGGGISTRYNAKGGELKSTIQVSQGNTIKAVSINGRGTTTAVATGIFLNNTPILFTGAGYGNQAGLCGGAGYTGGRFDQNTGLNGYSYDGSVGNWNVSWQTWQTDGVACGAVFHSADYTARGGNGYIASAYSSTTTFTNASNSSGAYIKIVQYV